MPSISTLITLFLVALQAGGAARSPASTAVAQRRASSAPYTLELEVNPTATFPGLRRFGTIDVTVYPGGVRAESLILHMFSRTGSPEMTVLAPLSRLYAEVPVGEARNILLNFTNSDDEMMPGLGEFPIDSKVLVGKVRDIPAKRYRVVLGVDSWIDVWSTTVIPENPQFERLQSELVSAISRPAAILVRKIPGTSIYIELNTQNHRKVPFLRLKSLVRSNGGETEALQRGRFYARAPGIDFIWK